MSVPGTPSGPTRTGLDERLAAALAYVVGPFSGVAFLLLEKENRYIRFHAMQSTMVFLALGVLQLMVINVPIVGRLLAVPYLLAVVVLWALLMLKAFRGERYKLPYIGDWAEQQTR